MSVGIPALNGTLSDIVTPRSGSQSPQNLAAKPCFNQNLLRAENQKLVVVQQFSECCSKPLTLACCRAGTLLQEITFPGIDSVFVRPQHDPWDASSCVIPRFVRVRIWHVTWLFEASNGSGSTSKTRFCDTTPLARLSHEPAVASSKSMAAL